MKILVVVSDRRMCYLSRLLSKYFEVFEINKAVDIALYHRQTQRFDAFVFGMKGVSNDGFIEMNGFKFRVKELLKLSKEHCIIFTGKTCKHLTGIKGLVVNFSQFETLKSLNAKLSAQGVLMTLLKDTPEDICAYSYDVLGYGDCGKEIIKLLLDIGCQVRVVSRQNSILEQCTLLTYEQWEESQPNDIIINTAHACVINEDRVKKWQHKPIIIDISSAKMGVDVALHQQFDMMWPTALPAGVAPLSCAKAMLDIIVKEINNENTLGS